MAKNFNITKVIDDLNKKKIHCSINTVDISRADAIGIKTWSKIDYLVNNCRYRLLGMVEYRSQFANKESNEGFKVGAETLAKVKDTMLKGRNALH